jgi:hypothetical protein
MSTKVQFRRGTTSEHSAFTGSVGEITVDTDKEVVVVHDGTTVGGWPAPSLAFTQAAFNAANAAGSSATVVAAFTQANSAFTQANSGYTQANTATTNAAAADSKAVTAGLYANSAYTQANTDYTTISATAGVYGGSTNIPVITLAANGRVSSITNTAISIPSSYTDANVAAYLPTYTGNIGANRITTTGNVSISGDTTVGAAAFGSLDFNDTTGIITSFSGAEHAAAWTISFWYNLSTDLAGQSRSLFYSQGTNFSFVHAASGGAGGRLGMTASGMTYADYNLSTSLSLNTWYFITVSFTGNTLYIGLDGTVESFGGRTISNQGSDLVFGKGNIVNSGANNHGPYRLTDVSVIAGTALYTSNFTRPTTHPSVASGQKTLLLAKTSGTVLNNEVTSTNVTAPTAGAATFSSLNPILATGNITAYANVQASYFIGNGSQLTGIVSTAATAAFTQANAAFTQANTDYTTISATSGVYGGSSNIPVITLAANGRVSSITNTSISIPAGTSVYGNTGQITANVATGTVALGLATTAVAAGTYGGAAQVPVIIVDSFGRITSAANVAVSGGGGGGGVSITNDTTTNANTYYPMLSTLTTGSLATANTSSTKLYYNPSTGTFNSTIFNAISDKNAKTELIQIADALDKLKTLTGYTYTLIDSGERSAGLISQDVQQILPEAVRENNGVQSLNYNATIGLIIESIKVLSDKIDAINEKLG